jgi:hypothetical protein
MKNDKLIPGLILVCIGGVILLDNFGLIDFDWGYIWHLWPLFLIIAGVNLVFANSHSALATALKVGIVVLGFVFLIAALGNFGGRFGNSSRYSWFHRHYHDSDNDNSKDDEDNSNDDNTTDSKSIVKVEGSSSFNLPYAANTQVAQLSISGGGTSFNLSDTTNQLFKADTKEHFGKYEFTHSNNGSTYMLDFHMKDKKGTHFDFDTNDKSNSVDFKLNPNPIWDISVETGATALDFDLTKFKIRAVKLSGGAASLKVKLGQPLASTNVEVSTAMASVEINIPENAACKISTDSGLSSTDFNGFTKKDDGNYETTGFDAAKNKIYIHITGGLSDFKVNRY